MSKVSEQPGSVNRNRLKNKYYFRISGPNTVKKRPFAVFLYGRATGQAPKTPAGLAFTSPIRGLERLQEKWIPVFRPEPRPNKERRLKANPP